MKTGIMTQHSWNKVLRFLLEVTALVALSLWANNEFGGAWRYIMTVLCPLLFAVIWGVFAVKGDPSRSGKTVVATPGAVRLVLELCMFAVAVFALNAKGNWKLSLGFAFLVILHYLFSLDRIRWLFKID